jgi:hypothetical protein
MSFHETFVSDIRPIIAYKVCEENEYGENPVHFMNLFFEYE